MLDKAVAERIVHDYKVEAIICDSKSFRNSHFVDKLSKGAGFYKHSLITLLFTWVWHSN